MNSTSRPFPQEYPACEAPSRVPLAPNLDEVAAPIRAGMRARAIADACERLLLPAVLIDAGGRVLHVGRHAKSLLGGRVTLVAEHLVGRTPAARRAVQDAVSMALGADENAPRASKGIAVGLSYREVSPLQRLRGIVVLGPFDRDLRRRLTALRALLDEHGASHREYA